MVGGPMIYCIDTSAILDGWARWYPIDNFPAYWDNIESLIKKDELICPEVVLDELKRKEDGAHKWFKARGQAVRPLTEEIQIVAKQILDKYPRLLDSLKGRSGADPFVIALAQVQNAKVITGEISRKSEKKASIPDVCDALGVRYINSVGLIREQNWRFINA
jgi:uncharacterized protein YacL